MLWGGSAVRRRPGQVHPWHTDLETSGETGRTVTVWIGLDNTNQRSSLMLIPYSHHFGASLQASYDFIPIVKPFLGFGLDTTKIKLSAGNNAVLDAAGTLKATGTGTRLSAGVNIVPFPFTYLSITIGIANGNTTSGVGLGARFGGVI